MLLFVSEIDLALAVAPFTAIVVARELWLRRRSRRGLRAREEQAERLRREAMRAMHEALAAERAAQQSREEFLSRMSHELRTPLNAVIGFTRVLEKKGNSPPEDAQLLGRVRAGGEHLLRLVEDVLDQSRIQQGLLTVTREDVDVAAACARAIAPYRDAALARGLRFVVVVPATCTPIPLDRGRFEQVVQHVVDNAVKFTRAGAVKITLVTDAASGRPTRLTVSDSGIGIPADRLERVFLPFEQGQTGHERPYDGAGLGLPLAHQLCDAMAIGLSIDSVVGEGTRVTLRFRPTP
jgi:signal transduction histidine kinase